MGLPVRSTRIWVYVISGTLAGVAGVVYTSRLGSAQNITGIGWELDAIAAVVIGGTLLTGGSGFLLGSVIGALVLGPHERPDHPRRWHPARDDDDHHRRDPLRVRPPPARDQGTAAMSADDRYVVGVDFGTLSGRAVVVRVSDGAELGTAVHDYEHGVMDRALRRDRVPRCRPTGRCRYPTTTARCSGTRCPRRWQRRASTRTASSASRPTSPPRRRCPVPPTARRCARVDDFHDRPHAYVKLWKHHAAQAQADRINALAAERDEPWLPRYGGFISSEWEYAKALQLLDEDPEIYDRMDHWVEAADWIVWQLCGAYVRNACTAGYKGILQDGSYPSEEFEAALNPRFDGFAATKLDHPIGQLGDRAGGLTAEAARWTGLPEGIAVAVGNVDAHVTAPAAQAVEPGQMLAIMGTSTCHVMNHDRLVEVPGMCGVVDGGIVAGSSATRPASRASATSSPGTSTTRCPAATSRRPHAAGESVHQHLTDLAFAEPAGAHGLVALDWLNGNRSVLVDTSLSGLVRRPDPRHPGRAGVPRAARGHRVRHPHDRRDVRAVGRARARVRRRRRPAQEPAAHADVLRRAAHADLDDRLGAGSGTRLGDPRRRRRRRVPRRAKPRARRWVASSVARTTPTRRGADVYDRLYAEYALLHDYFGRGANDVMKRLKAMRREVVA